MWAVLGICSVLVTWALGQQGSPFVTISQGIVTGSMTADGNYFEFHGIPYADSTSGSHRFKAPLPPPSFEEIFIANRRDIKCVQTLDVGFVGTEDCLVANVFTPTLNNTRQLPVMVWIKGKEFDKVYEQEYSFNKFLDKEVVIVSLNYRESILGFLCLGTETAPGNAGLKDIVAGLRWVQENIAAFGGNPNDITLFGHGSGGAAVDLVTLSPMANGLIHKAIVQSGNAYAPWAVSRDNLKYAKQVAEALGHTITNIEELSNVFTRTSVAALMATINELDLTDNSLAFAPCVEKEDLEGVEPFLSKSPYQILSDGDYMQIPFIIGFVDNEGTIRAKEAVEDDWLERMESSFVDFIQPDLQFETEIIETETASQIRSFYFGNEAIDMSAINDFIEYNGDIMMLVSSIREIRARAMASTTPVYLYQFSYRGSLRVPIVEPLTLESAVHSEELTYMFHVDTVDQQVPDRDLTIGDILIERWTNFAKTGIPTSETSQILWRPFTSIRDFYLRILDDSEISINNDATLEISLQNPHSDILTFWDQIYEQYFLDAESKWDLDERLDEDEDDIVAESEEDNDNNDNEEEEEEEEEIIEEGEDEEIDEDDSNSASNTIGYTFLILTLFSLLQKFHSLNIL